MRGLIKDRRIVVLNSIAILLSLASAALYTSCDIQANNYWCIQLLDCLKDGTLYKYAIILHEGIWTTNYNIFINIINAVWDFPMYLFNNLVLGGKHGTYLYSAWYKIFVLFGNIFAAFTLRDIVKRISGDDQSYWVEYIPFLYLVSPLVQIGSIGIGQIDFLGVICALMVIKCFLSEKYYKMSFWISLSLVLAKPFLLFFYIPILIIVVPSIRFNILKCLGIISVFPILSYFLETVVICDYAKIASEMNRELGFVGRLFEVSFQSISVYLLISGIIIYLYIYKVTNDDIEKRDVMFFSLLFYLSFDVLVHWHFQWLLYGWWLLVIAGFFFRNRLHFLVLNLGVSIGTIVYCATRFPNNLDNSMLNHASIVGNILIPEGGYKSKYLLGDLFNSISEYSMYIGKTVFLVSLIMIVCIYYLDTRKSRIIGDNKTTDIYRCEYWGVLIQVLPMILFVVYTLMEM